MSVNNSKRRGRKSNLDAQPIVNDDDNENSNNSERESGSESDILKPKKKRRTSRKDAEYEESEMSQDDDSEDFDEPTQRNKSQSGSGKNRSVGRAKKIAMMDDTESESDDDDDDEDRVREAGVILFIDVENFMNHRRLHVKLNSHLNFITGRNGSGKSAIATALMITLGSSTGSTGRGKSLAGLVREGANQPAVIKVCLQNRGPDAYDPDTCGSKIIIERKINKSASGANSK